MSDDGEHGLTLIAFIGSVFSPYYAWARRRAPQGLADPLNHCAINVALYRIGRGRSGRGSGGGSGSGSRWAMTERGRGQVQRDTQMLQIGPSALRWIGDSLQIDLDEIAVPWPTRIRGTVMLHAPQRFDRSYPLAPQHHWCPIAPAARVEVALGALRWSGAGYLDANRGDAPLEQAFRRWDWSRAHLSGGRSAVFYDVDRLDDTRLRLGVCFHPDGRAETMDGPPQTVLPGTGWRVSRSTRADAGSPARVLRTLTDAPFYARSLLDAQWLAEPVTAMHESLSLTRFDSAWVQAMLPFRMPRAPG